MNQIMSMASAPTAIPPTGTAQYVRTGTTAYPRPSSDREKE